MFDLLICSLYKDWTMLTSDIDIENIAWAKKNIDLNPELRERIQSTWNLKIIIKIFLKLKLDLFSCASK